MGNDVLYFLECKGRFLFGFSVSRYRFRPEVIFVSVPCDAMRFTLDKAKAVIDFLSFYTYYEFALVPVSEV